MSGKTITLSAAGLRNIFMKEEKEEEFDIISGNKEMKMNRIFAEFLSPKISHIHHSDPTINSINLTKDIKRKNDKNSKNKNKKLDKILSSLEDENIQSKMIEISRGERIEIKSDDELSSLLYFSILLYNDELFSKLTEMKEEKEKKETKETRTIENEVEELEIYEMMNDRKMINEYSRKIDYLSARISKDQKRDQILSNLPKELFYLIINNTHFKHENDDTLFDIINKLFSKEEEKQNEDDEDEESHDIYEFYESIQLKKLSLNKLTEFLSKIQFSEMTNSIWTQVVELLLESKSKAKENSSNKGKENNEGSHLYEYDGNPNHRFEGIIHHLRGLEKTNPSDAGIINVTSDSHQNNHDPMYAVDFDSNGYFLSDNDKSWLKYDFKDKKIRPTRYSIKTRNDSDSQNPVKWCIEVSNTDSNKDTDWRIIDSRSGVTSVSKRNQSDTFDIQTRLTTEENYRYIRFRCTGNTSPGYNNYLAISSLEYSGTLIE